MANKVNIDQLALEVIKELDVYRYLTVDIVREAVTETAKETVKEIRENVQQQFPEASGNYAKSWAYKRDPDLKGKWRYSMIVYSKPPYYRLTHLLENGHAKVNGGRVKGRLHIAPAMEVAERNLENAIIEGLAKSI